MLVPYYIRTLGIRTRLRLGISSTRRRGPRSPHTALVRAPARPVKSLGRSEPWTIRSPRMSARGNTLSFAPCASTDRPLPNRGAAWFRQPIAGSRRKRTQAKRKRFNSKWEAPWRCHVGFTYRARKNYIGRNLGSSTRSWNRKNDATMMRMGKRLVGRVASGQFLFPNRMRTSEPESGRRAAARRSQGDVPENGHWARSSGISVIKELSKRSIP